MSNPKQWLSLPPEQRPAVCVLGGRSGTSLVTRLLNLLGVDLGREGQLTTANKANERGFWEHVKFVEINHEILKRYDAEWPKAPILPKGWEDDPWLDPLRERALALIRREFADVPLWGWKDPRSAATLPFWRKFVPNLRFVLCLRNPVDTARSHSEMGKAVTDAQTWAKLNGIEEKLYQAGVANWLIVLYCMLRNTVSQPRLCLLYEDVMEDWQGELRRMAQFIGRPEAGTDPAILEAVRQFHDPKLRHYDTSIAEVMNEPMLPPMAKAVFLSYRARVTLEREAQSALERGEAPRSPDESVPLDGLTRVVADAVQQAAAGQRAFVAAPDPEAELRAKDEADRQALLARARQVVQQHVPRDGHVAVISKGDDELLHLAGRRASHFPQDEAGQYAGYYPADSAEAVEWLDALRGRGATHLLVPQPSAWWLDHYDGFRQHLELSHQLVLKEDQLALYRLAPTKSDPSAAADNGEAGSIDQSLQAELAQLRRTTDEQHDRNRQLQQTLDAIKTRWDAYVGADATSLPEREAIPAAIDPIVDVSRLVQFPDVEPIFVIGASRSGTTAVAGALRKALGCFSFLEGHLFHLLPPMLSAMARRWEALRKAEGPRDYARGQDRIDLWRVLDEVVREFNQVYVTACADAGATRWLDKTPGHDTIVAVPLLAHVYPRAKFIYLHRHPIKRALSFLKKWNSERFPGATMESAIITWDTCMRLWGEVRKSLPAERFLELRQEDLRPRNDEVVASLTKLLSLSPAQTDATRQYLLNKRPESTGSSDDADEIFLEDVDWPADFKAWCRQTCEGTAAAWGYALSREAAATTQPA